jgi:4-amino-4-deoxy-L-arabinose transferase-like glycosyltransferase
MMAANPTPQIHLRVDSSQPRVWVYCIMAVCAALLCFFLFDSIITDAPIRNDARQNLQSAYNLNKWGVFSKDGFSERPSPDNYREPLPPLVTAGFISLLGERACLNGDCAEFGFNARAIKKINILWAFLVLFSSAVLALRITGSRAWTIIALVLVYACFLRNPAYIDSLYTEIPAAACMLMSALLLMIGLSKPGRRVYCLAGIMLGCLVLTKAVFLYILLALVVVTAVVAAAARGKRLSGHWLKNILMLSLGVLITITPWIARNTIYFGHVQISSRGGLALYTRALINQMDPYEYAASFHYWGPGAYRSLVRDTALDIDDREYEPGGRAVRLNSSDVSSFVRDDTAAQREGRPEDVVSFYRRARAQRVKVSMDLKQAGHPAVEDAADAFLRTTALAMIVQHPFRHVLATLPLAWRGMWCFYGGGIFTILCAAAYGAFVFMCLYGLARKRREIIVLLILPFFLIAFNAFFTNNLPRFNAPAIPFMILCLVFTAQRAVQRLKNRFAQRGGNYGG